MKSLTKVEELVMQILWKLETAYLKDIADSFTDPKLAYTTVSTMVRILIDKGFIGYNTHGSVREYYPKVKQEEYLKTQFNGVLKNYFKDSFSSFASFYTDDENISLDELKEIQDIINKQIKNRKENKDE